MLYRLSLLRSSWLGVAVVLGCGAGCGGTSALTTPDYEAVLPSLEAQAEATPDDARTLRALAEGLLQVGETERAYDVLLEAERLGGDPRTFFALGLTEEALGNLDEAAARYEEVDPASPYATVAASRSARLARSIAEADLAATLGRVGYPDPPFAEGDVAVFPFAADEPDARTRALGRAVAETVAIDLASVSGLRVAPSANVAVLLRHHGLSPGDLDASRVPRLGRLLQVRYTVSGRLGAGGGGRLGAVLGTSTADGVPDTTRFEVAGPLSERVRTLTLGLLDAMGFGLTASERSRLGRLPTDDPEALLLYGLALVEEDAGRFEAAATLHAQAATRDPGFQRAAARAAVLRAPAPPAGEALLALRFTDGVIGAEGLVARRLDALGQTLGALVVPEAGARNPRAEAGPSGPIVEPFPVPPSPPSGN